MTARGIVRALTRIIDAQIVIANDFLILNHWR
jgi:hypothetical protein